MRYAIDPTKLETELGWEPKYNFDTGIAQTIEWYLNNKEWWQNILSGEYANYFDKMYGNRLYWGITLVLMILIFSFSAKNGTSSAGMSIGYAKELARILSFLGFFQIHSNADLMMHAEAVHTFVRKTAHFTEYAVLGFFTYKAVSCDVLDRKKAVLTAQLISTGYASTDEIHQMFVPGREGKVFDVMIDSCGAFCGIMVSLITQKLIEKKKGNQI